MTTVLAFDTSGPYCAAALLRDGAVLGATCEDMTRGQAERLMPLLEELLAAHALGWQNLDRIGVGIGPGNFTGIRISVSAARGLALGLNIPAIGVTSFDALRAGQTGVASVSAPRDMAYLQVDQTPPELILASEVPLDAARMKTPAGLAEAIARLALTRPIGAPPAPFYLRPADAAPPRDAAPVILDDA